MKYAQLLIGLFAGTALGGAVVASNGTPVNVTDKAAMKQIIRDTLMEDPTIILDAVKKYQEEERQQKIEGASKALDDADVRKQVFESPDAGSYGPKDAKKVVVEFFDYNCGACKMMYGSLNTVLQKDKDVRVIFHEYPIFGPVSDTNAKIGIAVNRLYPEKYYDFHVKMITHEGQTNEEVALGFVKALGMDADKVKAESEKPDVMKVIEDNRALGDKLHIQGTPTLVIGSEVVPHALSPDDLEEKLNAIK